MKQISANIKWGWLKDAVPIFILGVFAILFFSEVLFENKIFMHRDLLRFFYPLREFSVSQFKLGQLPLWNPYIHCGSPHLAEFQTSVFYPLSIIYLLFPFAKAFNYFIIFHIFLAGFFTYLLMREWRYSRYAAFLSASVFMFSGYIISVINLLASLGSVVWLPLVILFYERALKKDWLKNSILTGIFLALMLLGGGEPVILVGTILILVLLGRTVLDSAPLVPRSNNILRAKSRRILLPLTLTLLVTAGLAAFQILPFLEFLRHSSRPAMGFGEAAMWSLPPYALLDLVVPYLSESDYLYKTYWTRQSWLLVYYMGLLTLICGFIALKFDTTKRRKTFFYILALGLVLSFGRYTPVYYFLYRILPGFSLSRYPIKFFFMVTFSLAVLGGMGLDYYRKHYRELKAFLRGLLIVACAGSFLYLLLNLNFGEVFNLLYNKMLASFPAFVDKKSELAQLVFVGMHNLQRSISYFMLLALFMFIPLRVKVKLNLIIPILLCVSFLDVFTTNKILYLNMDIDKFLKPGKTIEFLKKDKDLFRIFDSPTTLSRNMYVPEKDYFEGVHSLKERMVSNRGVSFGIHDAYGYGSIYNKRHEEIVIAITKQDLPSDSNLLDLLNVKYVISPKDFKTKGYKSVSRAEKANIYENKNVLPRAFLVDKAIVIKDEEEILARMKTKDFDPAKEVILEEVLDSLRSLEQYSSSDSREEYSEIVKYSPGKVVIEANVGSPQFLVLSDSYYPGWKAYIDGEQAKIYRADYILRAVHIDPGRHTIEFIYDPFSFKIGAIMTLAALALIIVFLKRAYLTNRACPVPNSTIRIWNGACQDCQIKRGG